MHAALGARPLVKRVAAAILMMGGAAAPVADAIAGGAAEFDQGARLAAICASCHDPDGKNHGIPPLTGLDQKAITDALARYRAREDPSIVMHAIALSLTDEEIASVARYLANRGKEAVP